MNEKLTVENKWDSVQFLERPCTCNCSDNLCLLKRNGNMARSDYLVI